VGRSVFVGPSGDVLHQAGAAEEVIPLEIDIDRVRRERAVGLRGLGQPLKSFRDREVDFPVYDRKSFDAGFLDSLGPLTLPQRPAGGEPRRRRRSEAGGARVGGPGRAPVRLDTPAGAGLNARHFRPAGAGRGRI
jgi:hypothetical protein